MQLTSLAGLQDYIKQFQLFTRYQNKQNIVTQLSSLSFSFRLPVDPFDRSSYFQLTKLFVCNNV